jgi:hypothetical protein
VSASNDENCELCEAARFTHWYYEDEICWVADCEVCSTPMVVWKQHGTEPDPVDIEWMIRCLIEAAAERFGDEVTKVDRVMRQIPEHFHAHARDKNWLTRRWQDKPSKYSGVGGSRELLG